MASRNRIDTLRVEDEQKTKIVFFYNEYFFIKVNIQKHVS